jgi:hypothetical protein
LRTIIAASLVLFRAVGNRRRIATCVEQAALIELASHRTTTAARLLAAVERVRREIFAPPEGDSHFAEVLRRAKAGARAALGEAEFASAWAVGAALPLDEAVSEVLALADTILAKQPSSPQDGR